MQRLCVFLFILWLTCFRIAAIAQCISTFPYTEDFNQSNGGWMPGGTASDWAWGVPKKNVIFYAENTNKCWIVGGLTGNFYNENEASWLQSQCFDFSQLTNPYLSFSLNWDTETGYDGAALQYSIDKGINWQSAGSFGDAPTGCNDNHWFNSASISYGMQTEGWSGSNSRGGSLGWVKAYHSFPQLAGKANVIFRFVFGAGKIKNDFNGFAVDDIYVGETATDQLSFTYTCSSTPKQASFIAQTNDCIVASSLQWNFDDLASGTANTAQGNNVLHVFSSPRSYDVMLTGKNNRNESVSSKQTIIIPDVVTSIKTPVICHGNTGVAEASVTNTNAAVSYSWSTNPVITTSSAQLKAGSYQVTVSVAGGCSNSVNLTLIEPAALEHQLQTIPADCNNQNGTISIAENGGTPPYRYAWQRIQYSTPSANNLPSGSYSIVVTDQNSCTDKIDVALPMTPSSLTHTTDTNVPDCGVSNGSIKLNTSGGAPGYTYQWMPGVSRESQASAIPSGNYTVITTDAGQCHDTALITLSSKLFTVSLGNDTFVCKGQMLLLKPAGNFASYSWNDGSASPVKTVSREGNYAVTVTNAGGCMASDTIHIAVGCGDLVFPSVFTPNGDGLNEQFGPLGGLSLITSYRLLVYNRFGNLIFQSANPYQKWNGDIEGKKLAGTYTYISTYTFEGEKKMKKGTIVVFL